MSNTKTILFKHFADCFADTMCLPDFSKGSVLNNIKDQLECKGYKIEDIIDAKIALKYDGFEWDLLCKGTLPYEKKYVFDIESLRDGQTENCINIESYILVNSINNYLETGKTEFVPIPEESLPRFVLKKALRNRFVGVWNVSIEDVTRFITTPSDLQKKVEYLISNEIKKYYDFHRVPLNIKRVWSEYNSLLRSNIVSFVEEDRKEGYILSEDLEKIREIRENLSELEDFGKLHVFNGLAGTGKTYSALKCVPPGAKDWIVIALSNTVALNAYQRAKKDGKQISPCSITLYKIYEKVKPKMLASFSSILIDEFSQWGSENTDTLLSITRRCLKSGGELIVMGDEHQIPTFLGKGNWLHALTCEFKDSTTELIELKRAENKDMGNAVIDFALNQTFANIKQYFCDKSEVDNWISAPDESNIIVTGSNDSVEYLNRMCFQNQFGAAVSKGSDFWKKNKNTINEVLENENKIPVICKETFEPELYDDYNDENEENPFVQRLSKRIISNEQGFIYLSDTCYYFESKISERRKFELTFNEIQKYLTLRYAITVNKSQGLEWDNVLVHLKDIDGCKVNLNLHGSFEAMYVAMSRAKKKLLIYPKDNKIPPPKSFSNPFNIVKVDNVLGF